MGERKGQNKYFPPDFDPDLLPRNKKPRDRQISTRLALPFTMFCTSCSEIMYRGTKFNSKHEIAQDMDYLGIKIHRFFLKCSMCCSQITFRTDPEHADYRLEHGAKRKDEVWDRDQDQDDTNSSMEVSDRMGDVNFNDDLERLSRTAEQNLSRLETMHALGDLQSLNERPRRIDTDTIIGRLRSLQQPEDNLASAEDEAAVLAFRKQAKDWHEKGSLLEMTPRPSPAISTPSLRTEASTPRGRMPPPLAGHHATATSRRASDDDDSTSPSALASFLQDAEAR